ncbi:marine proteobacterial sortase target protein [Vibrio sp. TH_r3]|uniref:marine proteobacterial sortase target protein n=1 Tax=Vibrio sp. TH_r3 TaxID=3082084 RepID=UPI002953ACBE|nr:marine proteobacterial sortase target protein [Vibrio sp. TH_r3]MDV7103365.1 marine proteobacterial sortase target protein [Vibrio sp. TH_r3]
MMKKNLSIIALMFLIFVPIPEVNAMPSNRIVKFSELPYSDIKSGTLFLKSENGYQYQLTQQSDFQVDVTGMLARTVLTQSFENSSDQWMEAIYLFPLSEDSVVDAMEMVIGERTIVGEIRERKQADQLYQQAKQQGKKASLLSQKRPNMFVSEVANIAPGETIKVTIHILQPVTFNNDEFSLRLPLTITPRFTPHNIEQNQIDLVGEELSFSGDSGWASTKQSQSEHLPQVVAVSSSLLDENKDFQRVNINVALTVGLSLHSITSDNHKIQQSKVQAKTDSYQIKLTSKHDEKVRLDADFVLRWKPKMHDVPQAALFSKTDDHDQFALLMLMPPNSKQVQSIKKEVIYIIDTSGSMGGTSIRQAKEALKFGLTTLDEHDTFNIIEFDNQASVMFSQSLPANSSNIYTATHWVEQLHADGGTNMASALSLALNTRSENDRLRQVIFITDGSVDNEVELFNFIESNLMDTRLHTVGIGSAPNSYFMSEAAKAGRGSYRYISDLNKVQLQMAELFNDISRPLMQNLKLNWPADKVEFYPKKIPDLYEGQPLVITARWPKDSISDTAKMLSISGRLANNNWQQSVNLAQSSKQNGIDKIWAREKVRDLTQEYRRTGEEQRESLQQQIVTLSLHHQIMSPYTSFVAIEQKVSRPIEDKLNSLQINNLMPKGSQLTVVPMANTSLGIQYTMTLALYMLLVSLFIAGVYYLGRLKLRYK